MQLLLPSHKTFTDSFHLIHGSFEYFMVLKWTWKHKSFVWIVEHVDIALHPSWQLCICVYTMAIKLCIQEWNILLVWQLHFVLTDLCRTWPWNLWITVCRFQYLPYGKCIMERYMGKIYVHPRFLKPYYGRLNNYLKVT